MLLDGLEVNAGLCEFPLQLADALAQGGSAGFPGGLRGFAARLHLGRAVGCGLVEEDNITARKEAEETARKAK